MNNNLPIFLKNDSTKTIFEMVKKLIPENTEVYIFGGSIRNALYFEFFKEEMTQRDYDCIVIGDGELFAKNLVEVGFVFGSKNSDKDKILKIARNQNPVHIYNDWLYLDCKIFPSGSDIKSILEKISDLTISGVALNVKDVDSLNWRTKIISIDNAVKDIEERQLRVVNAYSSSIYKIIRLIHKGFKPPISKEIKKVIEELKNISETTHLRHEKKTIEYIGNKEEITEIAKRLGIDFDVLDFSEIKKH